MLDQAVQAFTQRTGTVVQKRRSVGKNAVEVETTSEVVRITQDAAGNVSLIGWHKVGSQRGPGRGVNRRGDGGPYIVLTGVYFPSSGWRFGSRQFTIYEYPTIKGYLPK